MSEEITPQKRGRPKKIEKVSREEYDRKRYLLQKEERSKKYNEEKQEKIEYSKKLQSKYRQGYKLLEKLYKDGKISTTEQEYNDIKKLIE
jgi:hypothetical protein